MPLDISKVPFYKAVSLFEAEKYQEAFNGFLECHKRGNLYASYYLEHIQKILPSEQLKLSDEEALILKTLHEYLNLVPDPQKGSAWLKASLAILKMKKGEISGKQRDSLLNELAGLAPLAGNAAVFRLQEFLIHEKPESGKLSKQFRAFTKSLANCCDPFTFYHLVQNKLHTGYSILEWPVIDGLSFIVYREEGNLERMMSKYYDPTNAKSPLKSDDSRRLQWQTAGAYLGNKELQVMFSQPGRNKRSKQEMGQWLEFAARNGERQAQILLGVELGKRDIIRSRILLEAAIKPDAIGNVPDFVLASANLQFGKLTEDGLGGLEANPEKALQYYQKAEDLGFYSGAFNIAIFYEKGHGGLEKNFAKAILRYEKAIALSKMLEADDEINKTVAIAYKHMGQIYVKNAEGEVADVKKAAAFKKAIECYQQSLKHFPETWVQVEYGKMLLTGMGINKDIPSGLRLLIPAAEKGDRFAAYQVAISYMGEVIDTPKQYGLTLEKIEGYLKMLAEEDQKKEVEKKAAKDVSNAEQSQNYFNEYNTMLGTFYLETCTPAQHRQAFDAFKNGVTKGEAHAFNYLGRFYEYGCEELGIKVDLKQAYEYYAQGAEAGDRVALQNQGFFLSSGCGIEKDRIRGEACLKRALELGEAMAAYNLAVLYEELGNKDRKEIYELLLKAESTEDLDVLHHIGLALERGDGVARDETRALSYYHRAFKEGSTTAAHNYIGIILERARKTGSFTFKDMEDILEKAELGAAKGYAQDNYLACILRLIFRPQDKLLIIKRLEESVARRPYKMSNFAIEYLRNHEKVTQLELLCLLYHGDPNELFQYLASNFPAAAASTNREEDNKLKADGKSNTANKSQESQEKADSSSTRSQKRDQLKSEINDVTQAKNIKMIDFRQFNQLLSKIADYTQDDFSMHNSSGGSNHQYKLSDANSGRSLHFSYHPRHKSGSGVDAAFDRRRARSLQKFLKLASAHL